MTGAIGPGAPQWTRSEEVPVLGGKRRKHRKTRKGGMRYGGVSASFQGQGERGLANFTAVNTRGVL